MKHFLSVIVAFLGVSLGSMAQTVDWPLLELTNAIPKGASGTPTTNSPGVSFSVENWKNFAFQFSYQLGGSNQVAASNVVVQLEKSIDSTNWATLDSISVLANGTNTVTYVTNYDVGAIPYIRVARIINANLTNVVGLNFWISRKRGI